MKLRALNRNPWDDFDVWQGRFKGHVVEIGFPYRDIDKYGKGYRVTIKYKRSIVHSSKLLFDGLEKAREFSIQWIANLLEARDT
ncbi:hypothetical protein [Paenibacillus sp. 1781tsa1]|uniref:hypothetical protein n=1 Tax=Paenibacillus sp. 1781tsa1 TaxID=2953810 RepID=UPI00209DC582|nr:hypothetical protein [Paenibacillus sp. 1781tsa1]MCP1185039.1 hypothetical protein [Paenibacillus sp. 1781tsa1]